MTVNVDGVPPPTVNIGAPANGSISEQGKSVSFSGSATDGSGSPLTGGSLVWASSRDGQIGTGSSFSRSNLSVGAHTITLTATDGGGLSNTDQVSITIEGVDSRFASITQPSNGASFVQGESVSFAGTGTDGNGDPLTGGSLVWTSSQGGQIGTGVGFSRSDLALGAHTITLTATDGSGLTATASVSLTITATPPPTVNIGAPAHGSTSGQGESVSFVGSATDGGGSPLTGGSLVWTSSRDGSIGTGTSFAKTNLSVGTHTITLTATDGGGLSNTDQVSITVTSGPSPSLSGRILFSVKTGVSSQNQPVWALWSMKDDGSDKRPVTTDVSNRPIQSTVSPDGFGVAYSRSGPLLDGSGSEESVRVVRSDGTGSYKLLSAATHPSFAPDGNRIAMWKGGCTLVVMEKDGSGRRDLFQCPNPAWADPGMSPQAWYGDLLMFNLNWRVVPGPQEVWIANSESGDHAQMVAANSGDVSGAAQSPTGAVAYTSTETGSRKIWLYSHSTKAVIQLFGGPGEQYDPVWSGDGRRLAFTDTYDGNPEIYIYDFDTKQFYRLTNSSQEEANPYWVP